MRLVRISLLGLAVVSLMGLAACGSDDDSLPTTAAPTTAAESAATTTAASTPAAGSAATTGEALELEGVTWTLSDKSALGVALSGVDITARFLEGQVNGFGGCNQYSGTYVLNRDNQLTIKPGASTMMACPDPQMAAETAYLKALPLVAGYEISGETLTLSGPNGTALLVYDHVTGDQLLSGDWEVTAVRTANAVSSTVAGSTLTMKFDNGQVSGSAGCNTFSGSYTVEGDELTFGPLATTRKACADPAIGQQETDFLAALGNTKSYSARGDVVTLLADDGTITVTLVKT